VSAEDEKRRANGTSRSTLFLSARSAKIPCDLRVE
jgi:hypothetical protein